MIKTIIIFLLGIIILSTLKMKEVLSVLTLILMEQADLFDTFFDDSCMIINGYMFNIVGSLLLLNIAYFSVLVGSLLLWTMRLIFVLVEYALLWTIAFFSTPQSAKDGGGLYCTMRSKLYGYLLSIYCTMRYKLYGYIYGLSNVCYSLLDTLSWWVDKGYYCLFTTPTPYGCGLVKLIPYNRITYSNCTPQSLITAPSYSFKTDLLPGLHLRPWRMFSYTSEENRPVYKIIDLDNNKLVIPQLSFITTFSNPFYTKRNAEIPQIIAKTALFDVPLIIPFEYIEFAFQYLPHHTRFDPISGEPIARYTLYIVVHNNLPEIKEYRIQNIWIKVIDINTYFNLYTKISDLNDMKFVYFIFVDFSCWGDIVSQSMKNFNISISGGDTSKRHLLSDVSVRLNFLILIFTGLNLDFVNKHLLFNTVDKNFIVPGSFITKDTDNHFSLNISRLKNNPFSLFRDTQKRSFHSFLTKKSRLDVPYPETWAHKITPGNNYVVAFVARPTLILMLSSSCRYFYSTEQKPPKEHELNWEEILSNMSSIKFNIEASRKELERVKIRLIMESLKMGKKHSLAKLDRADPFLNTILPWQIENYTDSTTFLPKKIANHIYGMKSYLFSSKLQFNFPPEQFEDNIETMRAAAIIFLNSLSEETIYKCMVIGITDEGEIKSSKDGAFFISKHTRPEYLVMMMKKAIMYFAFKYRGVSFANWTLSYKVWLTRDMIVMRMDEALEKLSNLHAKEMEKDMGKTGKNPFDKHTDIEFYNRWLKLVGPYGEYKESPQFLIQQSWEEEEFKISVENIEKGETVSWVDKMLPGKTLKWVRMFEGGVNLIYEREVFEYFEVSYGTEFWESDSKEIKYDQKFGAADIETFSDKGEDGEGKQIPYAAGFKDDKGCLKLFYIKENEAPHLVIVRMIEELLSDRYNGCTFYVHNLARFDSRLILEGLGRMEEVGVRLLGRDMNEIFKIKISKRVGKKYVNVVFLDSFYQLPFKLETLGLRFNTDTKKTSFPYKFVTKYNLFYKGPKPPIKFFEGKITDSAYKDLKGVWDLKNETLEYLTNDIECLFQVMHSYNKTIYNDFQVNAVKLSSYSALSKKVYTTNFYKKTGAKIPVISGYLEDWIRRAYKGGVVDVIQHIVGECVKYDSNSHYPAAMLNTMPVGTPVYTDCENLHEIFGFCYAEITAPSEDTLACPILPTWDSNGDLHCPRGVWKDTYFSEELKNAENYGYKVKILSSIKFDKGEGLFDDFVHVMYARKAYAKEKGDSVSELMYKLIQNSLYGKAGQKEIIHNFKLISNDKVKDFELKNKTDLSHVFANKTLIRTQGKIDAELEGIITNTSSTRQQTKFVVRAHQTTNKVCCPGGPLYDDDDLSDGEGRGEERSPNARKRAIPRKKFGVRSSVSIAAAITAYARINMSKYKNIVGNKYLGGDTDSAIMEKELDNALIGKGLGMMKEECRLKFGLFADKKLYLMRDNKGATIIKSRGIGRDVATGRDILQYRDFLKLFSGEVIKTIKTKFRVMSDGIYIYPQPMSVRISKMRLLKIREEMNQILKNPSHPLYNIASEIKAINITSLIIWTSLSPIPYNIASINFYYLPPSLFFILLFYLLIATYLIAALPFKMKLLGSFIKYYESNGWILLLNRGGGDLNLRWLILSIKNLCSMMAPFNIVFKLQISFVVINSIQYARVQIIMGYYNNLSGNRVLFIGICVLYANYIRFNTNNTVYLQRPDSVKGGPNESEPIVRGKAVARSKLKRVKHEIPRAKRLIKKTDEFISSIEAELKDLIRKIKINRKNRQRKLKPKNYSNKSCIAKER